MRPVLTICVAILLCAVSTPTALATAPPAGLQSHTPSLITSTGLQVTDSATAPVSRIGIPASNHTSPHRLGSAAPQTDPHPFITEFYSQDLPVVEFGAKNDASAPGTTSNNQ